MVRHSSRLIVAVFIVVSIINGTHSVMCAVSGPVWTCPTGYVDCLRSYLSGDGKKYIVEFRESQDKRRVLLFDAQNGDSLAQRIFTLGTVTDEMPLLWNYDATVFWYYSSSTLYKQEFARDIPDSVAAADIRPFTQPLLLPFENGQGEYLSYNDSWSDTLFIRHHSLVRNGIVSTDTIVHGLRNQAASPAIAASPEGTMIAVAWDTCVVVRRLNTGNSIIIPVPSSARLQVLAICRGDSLLATLIDSNICVFRLEQDRTDLIYRALITDSTGIRDRATYACFSPDGQYLLVNPDSYSKGAYAIELASGDRKYMEQALLSDVAGLKTFQSWISRTNILWHANQHFDYCSDAMIAERDLSLTLFDVVHGNVRREWPRSAPLRPLREVAFSADGTSLFTSDTAGSVMLWQTSDGSLVHAVHRTTSSSYDMQPRLFLLLPDGKGFIQLDSQGVTVLDFNSNALGSILYNFGPIKQARLSPDGQFLAVVDSSAQVITIFDVAHTHVVTSIPATATSVIAVDDESRLVVVNTETYSVATYAVSNGSLLHMSDIDPRVERNLNVSFEISFLRHELILCHHSNSVLPLSWHIDKCSIINYDDGSLVREDSIPGFHTEAHRCYNPDDLVLLSMDDDSIPARIKQYDLVQNRIRCTQDIKTYRREPGNLNRSNVKCMVTPDGRSAVVYFPCNESLSLFSLCDDLNSVAPDGATTAAAVGTPFPNPASETLTVPALFHNGRVSIRSLLGDMLYTQECSAYTPSTMSVAALNSGWYIVESTEGAAESKHWKVLVVH